MLTAPTGLFYSQNQMPNHNKQHSALIQAVLNYLSLVPGCLAWQQDSMGVWDAKRQIYRKRQSKYTVRGLSDVFAVYRGVPLGLEIKTGSGTPNDNQVEFWQLLERAGGLYFVIRSLDDVTRALAAAKARSAGSSPAQAPGSRSSPACP